jgi:Holliday junction resolvase RusA-like endonuclease
MIITLPFPVSVNSAYNGGSGQKRFKSKSLKAWIEKCPKEIKERVTDYPIHIHYKFAFPCARNRDGQNYMKVALDYLVNMGVLIDDNYKYVSSETWSHIGIDRENPRVEIIITNQKA